MLAVTCGELDRAVRRLPQTECNQGQSAALEQLPHAVGEQFGRRVLEDLVQIAMIELVKHLPLDDSGEILEVDDDAVPVESASDRHFEAVRVTVEISAPSGVPREPMGRLEGVTARHAGRGRGHEATLIDAGGGACQDLLLGLPVESAGRLGADER